MNRETILNKDIKDRTHEERLFLNRLACKKWRENHPEKMRENSRLQRAKYPDYWKNYHKNNKKYVCLACGYAGHTPTNLKRHFKSKKHLRNCPPVDSE